MTWFIYGIQRQLIGVGSITEVKQRRARFIIGWATACGIRKVCHRDCQVLYRLHLWGSESHVNQIARLTDLELDVKELQ